MKKRLPRIVLLLIINILVIGGIYYMSLFYIHNNNPDFLKIDSCQKASGLWDYDNQNCQR